MVGKEGQSLSIHRGIHLQYGYFFEMKDERGHEQLEIWRNLFPVMHAMVATCFQAKLSEALIPRRSEACVCCMFGSFLTFLKTTIAMRLGYLGLAVLIII